MYFNRSPSSIVWVFLTHSGFLAGRVGIHSWHVVVPSWRWFLVEQFSCLQMKQSLLHMHHPPWYSLSFFPFFFSFCCFFFHLCGHCHAVKARLCHRCCGHVIGLGPYLLSMTSLPSAPVAVPGFSSFHFCFAPLIKHIFCHSSLATLNPAPLLPLDNNDSIAWSVHTSVQYIKLKYMAQ